jgi:sugar (pentulose or hexulose) kinase
MPVTIGLDIGTTTITALAINGQTGEIVASANAANDAEVTVPSDKARGYSEWDADRMVNIACGCLRQINERLATRRRDLAGLAITGQQHGGVLVDSQVRPITPLINWQDRRSQETVPGSSQTYLQRAQELVGENAPARAGCRLHSGFMAVTLFWLKERGVLPSQATACLVMDLFAARITGQAIATEPTCAGSFGVLDVRHHVWDREMPAALGLPESLLPPIHPSGERTGSFQPEFAELTGLPAGLPVFGALGDNQASFFGSVVHPGERVLVNVGTGGQVAARLEEYCYDPRLEPRPFLDGKFLLVCPGLCGGRTYATLARFFRQVGLDIFQLPSGQPLYERMNHLAEALAPGAEGLRCEPFFTGTRQQPALRATWSGMTPENFTPAHMTRALLEGMARAFRTGYEAIRPHLAEAPSRLVCSGNGMRENPLLRRLVAEEFGLPASVPRHREEAAYGAALLAAIGAGVQPDLVSASRLIQYETADLGGG